MLTITVSNRKGGSGKSTTAVNLAAELAKKGSVLLVDFDTQGHASIGAGAEPVESGGAHSIFLGKTLSETFKKGAHENLTVAPAELFFDVYEHSQLRGVLKNRFRRENIHEFFDFCVIDTPPTYDALLKNAIEVADAVIIPLVPHYLGTVGVEQMFRAIYQTVKASDRPMPFVGALPVMFNPHINEHVASLERIKESFGADKLFSPIGVDINLSKQFEQRMPVVLQHGRCKGSKNYKEFASELLFRVGHPTENRQK